MTTQETELALSKAEIEATKQELELLSELVKAGRGEFVNIANELLRQFVNTKNTEERSFLPTLPLVWQDDFLRLFSALYPDIAKPAEQWADQLATSLIGYKGYGGERAVELIKAQQGNVPPPGTNISFMGPQQQQPQKRGFFKRAPKPERSEFENE